MSIKTLYGASVLALLSLSGCGPQVRADAASTSPAPIASDTGHAARTEATRAVATAFLKDYFIDHDFGAYAKYASPDFIQHNPNIADGVAGHRAYFAKLFSGAKPDPAPPPQAHVIDMLLVDGDLFSVMHHGVNADGTGRIFVDIWRVEDGKIAEHWDVIQDLPSTMPHENGMGCGFQSYAEASGRADSVEHPACGNPDPNAERAQSLQAYKDYTDQVREGDIAAAIERWFAPNYKQHSPVIGDGKQGAIDYLDREWGNKDAPLPVLGPQRIVAEGDLVLVHYMYHLAGQPDEAHVDIFRITDGLISEHWDIKQKVPSESANDNGMW